ncbi:multidrug resistance efflux transporter family protein [Halobacillus shinanisalinarum]|uniref:Multidrug resistance efflux transporter family protein n=1 Tax=Halobacillus shinanisalinarum TaxID=2932258 RepID=A0ABY4H0F3_9BACI|nr:multidrug resistance efflux transporter family protein [Halobacillus shinanisalinarum]UOQ93666.1 multidrug resistance efflux transporter family protein [Halobacillus shinanisalinarum]
MKDMMIGIMASAFFAVTFILNRSMEVAGGSWFWSSSLRFFSMLPLLFLLVLFRKNVKPLWAEILRKPLQWMLWSFVGFVMFYAPLTYSAAYGPGWLIAGTWQLTIVAGTLLSVLFYETVQTKDGPIKVRKKIPLTSLMVSVFILVGIVILQIPNAQSLSGKEVLLGIGPVLVAAFAFPLGNRKMMEVCDGRIDTFQRVLGMTIVSMPFWMVISLIGFIKVGLPPTSQVSQSIIVGVSSGVIATTLLFFATNNVRHHPGKLAAVEATQSMQVIFVIVGEMLVLSIPAPSSMAIFGVAIIIIGMALHSYMSYRLNKVSENTAVRAS